MSHRAASWLDRGHAAGPFPSIVGPGGSCQECPSLATAPDALTVLDIVIMTCRSLNGTEEYGLIRTGDVGTGTIRRGQSRCQSTGQRFQAEHLNMSCVICNQEDGGLA